MPPKQLGQFCLFAQQSIDPESENQKPQWDHGLHSCQMSVPEGQSNQRLILHKSQAAGGIDSLSFCQLHEIEYNVVEIIIINNNTTTTTKSQTLF